MDRVCHETKKWMISLAILTSSIFSQLSTFQLFLWCQILTQISPPRPPIAEKHRLLAFFRSHIALHSCFALMNFQFSKHAAGGLNVHGEVSTEQMGYQRLGICRYVKPKKKPCCTKIYLWRSSPSKNWGCQGGYFLERMTRWLDGSSFMSER